LRAAATRPVVAPLGDAVEAMLELPPRLRLMASMAARRTSFDPCFVIGLRLTAGRDCRASTPRPRLPQPPVAIVFRFGI
jgi:hypothetical protein